MKWPAMGYARVDSLDGLWRALDAAGPEAQILAGGQSLLATLSFRLSEPSGLIDITRIASLKGIGVTEAALRIGALTRHADLARDPLVARHAPLLAQAAPLIAHPAIRNRGTIGGSLALADPAAELPACVVALGATIVLASRSGERRVAASDFFKGLFTTDLEPGEIVVAVEVPVATAASRQTIVEVTRRSGDYAMAGLAAVLSIQADGGVADCRLVFFGVGSGAEIAQAASAALIGQQLSDASIAAAKAALADDLDPPSDLHGGPELKRHLAGVLLARALRPFLARSEQAA
ncbi:xanthine dehydrogenase family protein subunit M [Phreatobacter aquaticus]|uniref:Xanthine dehydrogenase family protein subunit M n=1 Tax=Phreatobacter aquaticus TaxID=2570229 RepID=A0A4D7QBD1_9HYPH|nr:xanthine dehydrogenase family protein subunit M [Phreatobacter aquaticus]QCK84478.1 xanthine dehydrogenase family protein subunit M [Phreatobacter aquaticus]